MEAVGDCQREDYPSRIRRISRDLRHVVREFWLYWGWPLTGFAALAALALGFIGFGNQHPRLSGIDRIYSAAQLFSFFTNTKPPLSAPLEVARWLAPVTIAYAALRAISRIFADQWTRFRARSLMRGHVIICGMGRCGTRLARSFREAGPVVVVDRSPTSHDIEVFRNLGIPVLTGDATSEGMLKSAGLENARCLIATCGDDASNADVASAALEHSRACQRDKALRCFIHIADANLCGQLEEIALGDPLPEQVRQLQLEYFNVYRNGPRALLSQNIGALTANEGVTPHVIVLADSDFEFGRDLVAEAAHSWWQRTRASEGPLRIRITLVAPDAQEQCRVLTTQYQKLHSICELVPYEINPVALTPADVLEINHSTAHLPTTAFVCMKDDATCLQATIRMRKALPPEFDVVASTTGRSSVATLLSESTSDSLSNVRGFSLLDTVCQREMLEDNVRERIAQAIHESYVRYRLSQRDLTPDDIALRPWDELDEGLRESNRDAARHIGEKLDAIDCRLDSVTGWVPERLFSAGEVEELAKLEHDRWCKERRRNHWRMGEMRDPARRITPYLTEWAKLPEEIREYDRNAIRQLPGCLAEWGFSIVPLSDTHDASGSKRAASRVTH